MHVHFLGDRDFKLLNMDWISAAIDGSRCSMYRGVQCISVFNVSRC